LGQLKGVIPAPAYDLLNTSLHISGDVFGLDGHLSPDIDDFERFGERIGLVKNHIKKILDRYMFLPDSQECE